jgi:hypothetical protein
MITNYGNLKTAVAQWLDRSDLTDRIPEFIQLAENKIFRTLRCAGNEQWATYPASSANRQTFQIPNDYLEAKILMYGSERLTRITDQKYLALQSRSNAAGTPIFFARLKDQLYLYPSADYDADISLIFYESQGPMVLDTDYTRTLLFAPDLYLYGALIEAQAFLIGDERIAVWGSQYQAAMAGIMNQAQDDEVSGSTVSVSGVYGDYYV